MFFLEKLYEKFFLGKTGSGKINSRIISQNDVKYDTLKIV